MTNRNALAACILLALSGTACATASAPNELVSARAAYSRAQNGPTAQTDPADLHTAAKALAAAEASFQRDGNTAETRDLAYIAERRVQIADAKTGTTQANASEQRAVGAMHAARADQLQDAKQQLEQQKGQLATERMNREAADRRAADAVTALQSIATVKQEPRGIVITLDGGVLFASGKSELLPAAQAKLNNVAEALVQQDPDSKMVVEGHTDSKGTVSSNQDLSQRRAQTVRDYLVSHGVASERVTASGFGSSRAIADNGSPEGRANNRRVEIVVGAKQM